MSDGVEAADESLLFVGRTISPEPAGPWAVKLSADAALEWQHVYRSSAPFSLGLVSAGASGRTALVGAWGTAGDAVVVLEVDASGAVVWSRRYSAPGALSPAAVARHPGGDLLVSGTYGSADDPFVLRLTDGGQLVCARAYPVGGAVSDIHMGVEADGGIRIAGLLDRDLWLLTLEPDDRTGVPCHPALDLAVTATDVPMSPAPTAIALNGPGAWSSSPSHRSYRTEASSHDVCGMTPPPRHIRGVRAVRDGEDVALSWFPDDRADGYHVWSVEFPGQIPLARLGGPGSGVPGCSPPSPAAAPACTDVGGVARGPAIVFYQVRGVAGGIEGP